MNSFKQPEIQNKALKKALKSPRIGKHGKRRITILKEEAYKEMQNKILGKVDLLVNAQLKLALHGNKGDPDFKSIDALLNRVFGKPSQEIQVRTETSTEIDLEMVRKRDESIMSYLTGQKRGTQDTSIS